jgi:hypothetical protein
MGSKLEQDIGASRETDLSQVSRDINLKMPSFPLLTIDLADSGSAWREGFLADRVR